jgi:two-component system, response regulator PdtaR
VTSLRIAVADDEPDMRDYFSRILPRLGHTVVGVAENGVELIALCEATEPDLVVTDLRMPEMGGVEASAAIIARRSVPIIWITAHEQGSQAVLVQNGVAVCLIKPITIRELAQAIQVALNRD